MRKKRVWALVLAAVLLLGLTACGGESEETLSSMAGRMVQKIEVSFYPEDAAMHRIYESQENMNALLGLLRDMEDGDAPETEPDLNDGQSYYTITVSRANGEQSQYHLLGHAHLRMGEGKWFVVDGEESLKFTEFVQSHPTDHGTAPAETTLPPETTQPPATE